MSGSENHLRAFNSQYEARSGEAYQPSYLSQEAYETIVASVASGNNAAGGNGNRGTGRGGRP